MTRKTASKLKLYGEPAPRTERGTVETIGALPAVCRAFQAATGWSLRYEDTHSATGLARSTPEKPGIGASPGRLRLEPVASAGTGPSNTGPAKLDEKRARSLASAISGLVTELLEARHALWQREAELAAGVPLAPHPEEEKHLAARLQATLRAGAEAVGCEAAALYLLDEATTQLKLRSCWGLPFDRHTAPPRPLAGALGDLEAMLGHAVVLNDPVTMSHWSPPEDFAAAVCVPVSSATSILGTLWLFSDDKLDFTDRETNMVEVVAGRVAGELEREMLLREALTAAEMKRELMLAERLQQNQLPTVAPLLPDWDFAAFYSQAHGVGGAFYDWFCLPGGLLGFALGSAMHRGIEAALSAGALKAALRAHGQYHREAEAALRQVNLTLWTGSAGDQYASLFYGMLESGSGRLTAALAGDVTAILLRDGDWTRVGTPGPQLGEGPESGYEQQAIELQRGDVLVLATSGVLDAGGRSSGDARLAEALLPHRGRPAEELAALVRQMAGGDRPGDRAALVVRRR
ncbi:MAG: PP2C family protein-serine/threonine phosphatase [Planctomycetota bacterium]